MENDAVKTHGKTIHDKTWKQTEYWKWNGVLVLATFRLIWFIVTFRAGNGLVAAASSFYSAASAIRRDSKGRSMTIGEKLKFRFAGAVALSFALLSLVAKVRTLHSGDQLDVVGTIFAKAGLRDLALEMNDDIATLHKQGKASDSTLALALKWRKDIVPEHQHNEINVHIHALLEKHPEWQPEIKTRLYETLGETELGRNERLKIKQKYTT